MSRLPRPVGVAQLASGAIAVLCLLPVLLRLPRVAVIACFDAGHPLYTLTPQTAPVDCIAAPGPVVGWVLMVAGTVLVQIVLLPVLLAASGLLARSLLDLARVLRCTLLLALTAPTVPVLGRVRLDAHRHFALAVTDAPHRAHPHRGPPSLD